MVKAKNSFSDEKFKVFVRYLIQVSREKRCVPYNELENVFGLGHDQVGYYAGRLGDYCISRGIPLLNCLIINVTDCIPSYGFEWYQKQCGKSWGEVVSDCWKEFHLTSSRAKQVQGFSKRDSDVDDFLENG